MKHYKNYNLTNYNSFHLSSIAKEIWFPQSIKDLQEVLKLLKKKKFFILGGGTNVILKPYISRIISLKYMPKYLKFDYLKGTEVSSNYPTSTFLNTMIRHNVSGFEGLYGIIGEIGGAVVMNSGSGKYSISDNIIFVTAMDYNGNYHDYAKKDLKLGRRYSIFQDKKEIIIKAFEEKICQKSNKEEND